MRVLYFGTYDKKQTRNRVMLSALQRHGTDVDCCHIDFWGDVEDKIGEVKKGLWNPNLIIKS